MAGELCANFASHISFKWWVFFKKSYFFWNVSQSFIRGFFKQKIDKITDQKHTNIWAIER